MVSFRVLVYSGGAHGPRGTIRAGVEAVRELGARNGFGVEATDDPAVFDDSRLARFHAVVFNNTAAAPEGDGGLHERGRAALQQYVRAGGGWVGLHDASDGAGDWDWYRGLVGAALDRSAPVQAGRVEVLDRAHPSTVALPDLWERTEDWLSWRTGPSATVHTLARIRVRDGITGLDEGVDHPWSWCQDYDGGRSWFTAGGHAPSAFHEEYFLAHLLGVSSGPRARGRATAPRPGPVPSSGPGSRPVAPAIPSTWRWPPTAGCSSPGAPVNSRSSTSGRRGSPRLSTWRTAPGRPPARTG